MKKTIIMISSALLLGLALSVFVFNAPISSTKTKRQAPSSSGSLAVPGGCFSSGTNNFGFPFRDYSYDYSCNDTGRDGADSEIKYNYLGILANFIFYTLLFYSLLYMGTKFFIKLRNR